MLAELIAYPLSVVCRVLGVTPSAFHAWRAIVLDQRHMDMRYVAHPLPAQCCIEFMLCQALLFHHVSIKLPIVNQQLRPSLKDRKSVV